MMSRSVRISAPSHAHLVYCGIQNPSTLLKVLRSGNSIPGMIHVVPNVVPRPPALIQYDSAQRSSAPPALNTI
jgi:hypothetical protein